MGRLRDKVILITGAAGGIGSAIAEAVVRNGRTSTGTGLMISSSRAILYAGKGEDFAQAARAATIELRDSINRYR